MTNRRCNDCGTDHNRWRGASAVYCDVIQGKRTPSLDPVRQEAVAHEFEAENPEQAAEIRRSLTDAR